MALTPDQMMSLMVEEKQILVTLDNAVAERDQAKADAEQAYVAALTAASDNYVAKTQKAESRLIDIRAAMTKDGEWSDASVVVITK